jgi:hypothetical protein
MIVVNILAILIVAASVALSEYSYESRCLEVYNVFAQIIRSQAFHLMQYNQYYVANPNELKGHGVDLSEAVYFTYSTFIDENSIFCVRADTKGWGSGGWILYKHKDNVPWQCDEVVIQRNWLP